MTLLKLLAKLKLINLVWIKLYDGTWELTCKGHKVPDGWMTYRFPLLRIVPLKLNLDGTTTGVIYINSWVDYK